MMNDDDIENMRKEVEAENANSDDADDLEI
jgi:hypothetical protein